MSEAQQRAKSGEEQTKKNLATVQQQKGKVVDIGAAIKKAETDLSQTKKDLETIKKSQEQSKQKISEIKETSQAIKQQTKQISQLKTRKQQIESVLKEGKVKGVTTGPPKPPQPKRSALTKPKQTYPEIVQNLFEKSNFPINQKNYLKSVGTLEDAKKYQAKSVNEALTRLAYAGAELTGQAAEHASFGLAKVSSPKRPGTMGYKLAGAALAPSALDYAAGAVVSKLGLTAKGRKIINKILDSTDDLTKPAGLTTQEARQFEKLVGSSGISTDDLRNLPKATLKSIAEIVEYYEKNPSAYTAGAAQVPQEVLLWDDFIQKTGWDDDAYINFLDTYGDKLNINPAHLVAVISKLNPERREKILKDLADYNLDKPIPGFTTKPLKDMSKTELRELAEQLELTEEQTDQLIEQPPSGGLGEQLTQDVIEIPEEPEPTIQEPDITPDITPEEPEPTPPEEPKITPPLKLSPKEVEERKRINLSLYRGKKVLYDVSYSYRGGKTQRIGPFEARSLPDALGKAQRKRMSSKDLPSRIVVNMIGEKR